MTFHLGWNNPDLDTIHIGWLPPAPDDDLGGGMITPNRPIQSNDLSIRKKNDKIILMAIKAFMKEIGNG